MSWFRTLLDNRRAGAPDYLITTIVTLLVVVGLVILASASSGVASAQFGDSYFYLKKQIFSGLLVGLVGFYCASRMYYGAFNNRVFSVVFLGVTLLLVCLVFTPLGFTAKGATRWVDVGFMTFQPAEFLKLSLVLYLASWLAFKDQRRRTFREGFLPFAIVLAVVSGILFVQRSTSPVVILIAVALTMYFVSGARLRYLFGIIGVGVVAIGLIIAVTPYRAQRVLTYLHPEADATGAGYHTLQAKTAIGAGGVTGVGYGQSVVKQRLPEPIGDSIFAVAGEEFGFVGTSIIVLLFATLVLRMYVLAHRMHDPFGRLLLIGFGSLIAIQALINMSAMTGTLPLTGTPLPFISYGGTALAIFMTMMGVVVNVSRYTSKS